MPALVVRWTAPGSRSRPLATKTPLVAMSLRLPHLLSLLATVLAAEDPHASHDHGGGGGWEWAGIFATPEDFYL